MFTLFIPGIEWAAGAASLRLPELEGLLARGRARPLADSPWALLARLAGGTPAAWPVGPVSALAELAAAPRCCLRVEPLGANEARGAFRLAAVGLGITTAEAAALATAFNETFAGDGLRLEIVTGERWYLGWPPGAGEQRDWRGFAGPAQAMADAERPAPPEAGLRRLLAEAEMLFHTHPVNAARRERGAPAIAGLHPWGGGQLPAVDALSGSARPAAEEPFLAGLRRLSLFAEQPPASGDEAVAGDCAWPAAVERLDGAALDLIENRWARPLAAALRRGRLPALRIVTRSAVHELGRFDAWRLWRRPRPLAAMH